MSDYVRLALGSDPGNPTKWINCLRATADFYGWSAACPPWLGTHQVVGGYVLAMDKSGCAGSPAVGGRRLRICRKASRDGYPRGATNAFRISSRVTKRDLAWLAARTAVPFGWMETKSFERLTEAEWLALAVRAGVAPAN